MQKCVSRKKRACWVNRGHGQQPNTIIMFDYVVRGFKMMEFLNSFAIVCTIEQFQSFSNKFFFLGGCFC